MAGITGLKMTPSDAESAVGLFAANGGEVERLNLDVEINIHITLVENVPRKPCAAIAGNNSGKIRYCHVSGSIHYKLNKGSTLSSYNSSSFVGSIAASNSGIISNCSNVTSPEVVVKFRRGSPVELLCVHTWRH